MNEETAFPPEQRPVSDAAEQHRIGNAIIIVTDDDFCNAYMAGYLTYRLDYQGKAMSDADIYEFIMQHLHDVRHTDRWNAGFVLGWAAGMHEKNGRKDRYHNQRGQEDKGDASDHKREATGRPDP
jgi:hypothetical protein